MLPVRKSESIAGLFLGIDLLHCRAHGPTLKIAIVEGLFFGKKEGPRPLFEHFCTNPFNYYYFFFSALTVEVLDHISRP